MLSLFLCSNNTIIGIATTSLNLLNKTVVNVGSLSTTDNIITGVICNIGIRSDKLILSQGYWNCLSHRML